MDAECWCAFNDSYLYPMKKWHVESLESSREILADKGKEGLGDICALLKSEAPQYDWVGFYWMNDAEQTLRLGAYSGASTEHVLIPYGKGICGQVALSGRALLVPNTHAPAGPSCTVNGRERRPRAHLSTVKTCRILLEPCRVLPGRKCRPEIPRAFGPSHAAACHRQGRGDFARPGRPPWATFAGDPPGPNATPHPVTAFGCGPAPV